MLDIIFAILTVVVRLISLTVLGAITLVMVCAVSQEIDSMRAQIATRRRRNAPRSVAMAHLPEQVCRKVIFNGSTNLNSYPHPRPGVRGGR